MIEDLKVHQPYIYELMELRKKEYSERTTKKVSSRYILGFPWGGTPEGVRFWMYVYRGTPITIISKNPFIWTIITL